MLCRSTLDVWGWIANYLSWTLFYILMVAATRETVVRLIAALLIPKRCRLVLKLHDTFEREKGSKLTLPQTEMQASIWLGGFRWGVRINIENTLF